MRIGRRPLWLSTLMYGILTLTSLVILYPLVFMVFSTFTSTEAYYRTAFFPIPDTFDFHNYQAILGDCSQGCITKSILITAARALWYIGWAMLISMVMVIFAMPAVIFTAGSLNSDRTVGTHLFNPAEGGDLLLWQHTFWFFGHPEVYIIFLPALGIISSILSAFCRREIFGSPGKTPASSLRIAFDKYRGYDLVTLAPVYHSKDTIDQFGCMMCQRFCSILSSLVVALVTPGISVH